MKHLGQHVIKVRVREVEVSVNMDMLPEDFENGENLTEAARLAVTSDGMDQIHAEIEWEVLAVTKLPKSVQR